MEFHQAVNIVINVHEKGFQNDPNDKGNWTGGRIGVGKLVGTKYGISAASYPHLDIPNLTRQEAVRIYKQDYWDKCHINLLPAVIRFDVFDTAIHSGPSTAIRYVQRAVRAFEDGIWGPETADKVQKTNPFITFCRFNGVRLDELNNNPKLWDLYGRGWSQRIADNLLNIG